MIVYALRRLAAIALILLVICAITFAIFYLLPDDPALDACGRAAPPNDWPTSGTRWVSTSPCSPSSCPI